MKPRLFFSTLIAEGEPPTFDPFPGALEPFAAVVLAVLAVLVVWWLLQFQVAQVEPVRSGHDDDGHGHEHRMEAPPPAAPAMAVEAEDVPPEMDPPEADDLKKLEGIGPKVAAVLEEAGIETYTQLAAVEMARLREILDSADYQYMDPASWPEQARLAAAGDWDALQKLQVELSAGRSSET